MLAAPIIDLTVLPPSRKSRWMPLGLSALLHVLLALIWLGFPASDSHRPEDAAMQVELAAEPPRPVPAPPPPAAATARAAPAQPAKGAEPGQAIPQLEDGILAQRSSPPKAKDQDKAKAKAKDDATITPAVPRPDPAPKPKKPEPVTQNERDFVLSQVLRHWKPPTELSAYDRADVRVTVVVTADGYFADAYDGRRPWMPEAVFDGYGALPADSVQRRTVDAFYRAIRQAQPLRLPAALKAKAPFPVRLDFRFKDAR